MMSKNLRHFVSPSRPPFDRDEAKRRREPRRRPKRPLKSILPRLDGNSSVAIHNISVRRVVRFKNRDPQQARGYPKRRSSEFTPRPGAADQNKLREDDSRRPQLKFEQESAEKERQKDGGKQIKRDDFFAPFLFQNE
jgi:hypothetical protein